MTDLRTDLTDDTEAEGVHAEQHNEAAARLIAAGMGATVLDLRDQPLTGDIANWDPEGMPATGDVIILVTCDATVTITGFAFSGAARRHITIAVDPNSANALQVDPNNVGFTAYHVNTGASLEARMLDGVSWWATSLGLTFNGGG